MEPIYQAYKERVAFFIIYGPPQHAMDPDMMQGEFIDEQVTKRMEAVRRPKHSQRYDDWPDDVLQRLRRVRRVQRGGAAWGSSATTTLFSRDAAIPMRLTRAILASRRRIINTSSNSWMDRSST